MTAVETRALDALRMLCRERLGVAADAVTPGARLREDLGLDSLDLAELGIEAEKRFKIEIPETTLGPLTTVGDVLALITTPQTPHRRCSMFETTPRSAAEVKNALLAKVDEVFRVLDGVRDRLTEIASEEALLAGLRRDHAALLAQVVELRQEAEEHKKNVATSKKLVAFLES
jgi:acyl carrier protein